MVICAYTKKIICTVFSVGKKHDYALLMSSNINISNCCTVRADKAFLKLLKEHENAIIPKKKPKGANLSDADKILNKEISRKRISIEHVIGDIKNFRIMANIYRNRRRRFSLRFNLIAGIYNYER